MDTDGQKLLGLLGLARRAGKLAIGFTAVEQQVRRGESPLVVVATGVGEGQLGRMRRWEPVRDLVTDMVSAEELARAMGREKLVVVGVSDNGFVNGIRKLVAGGNRS